MRAQAMEALLLRFEEEVKKAKELRQFDMQAMLNLSVKSSILRNRTDSRSASVIKELVNK